MASTTLTLHDATSAYLRAKHNTPGQVRAFARLVAMFRRDYRNDYTVREVAEMDIPSAVQKYVEHIASQK